MKKNSEINPLAVKDDEDNQKILYKDRQSESLGKRFVYFLVGLALFCGGIFLIFQNTTLYTNFTLLDIMGFTPPFGIVLIPFIIGVGVLFFNEKSIIGWFLTILGLVTIVLGIIMGLKIYFKPVSLYQGLIMFGMAAAGAGLTLKAIYGRKS
ncbi:hypothetical protein [Acetivibrio cellulolyticus]|uniref:hypothetical protein n=1 Tax=Acetivibrio cellulolyticus TaxID=35830 RepID=UPI0001E2DF10|nr:hypothetical protein [Acetivibrio cellulolyticus]